jgi:hypothetical protein
VTAMAPSSAAFLIQLFMSISFRGRVRRDLVETNVATGC